MTRQKFKIRGTFDIECSDWDRFAVAATYDGKRARVYYDGDEMLDELRRVGGIWLAHGGGIYDGLYVLERARVRRLPCQVDRSQHRVTRIVIGKLTIRDSYSVWPVPLNDICGALGRPTPKLPWRCVCRCTCGRLDCGEADPRAHGGPCGRSCGGYCQIRERAAAGDPDLEDYVKSDAKDLYDGFSLLSEFAEEHRITLRGTLGRTAWCTAQDEVGVPASTVPYELWDYAKQADKGGRTTVVRPLTVGPGAHHDICNAYPAQLARAELPVGECAQLGPHGAASALEDARPGVYTVSVTIPPDVFFPPLPWSKGGRITFPTGEISGTWVLPELVAAFERGTKIRAVHSALVWSDAAPVFAPLVERWYEIRRSVGRKTPLGSWVGRLAKAFTGTLAERPERQRVGMYLDKIKVCPRRGPCGGGKCTGRCGGYEQLDLDGHVWGIPYYRMSESAYPQWSSYLRAMTRVQWLSQAERMGEARTCGACGDDVGTADACVAHPGAAVVLQGGGRAVCLGNTDSLWHTSRQAPEPLGDGLGQWEYQHAWTDLEVRSPTVYAFRDPADAGPRGERPPLTICGIPGISEEDWRRGSGKIDRGVVTFGRAVKTTHGLFHRRSRQWSLPSRGDEREWYGDRKLGPGGVTYPVDADELRRLARDAEDRRRKDTSRR